jgi:hypothetical protein
MLLYNMAPADLCVLCIALQERCIALLVCVHMPNVSVKGSDGGFVVCADAHFFLMTGQKTDREEDDLDNDFHAA